MVVNLGLNESEQPGIHREMPALQVDMERRSKAQRRYNLEQEKWGGKVTTQLAFPISYCSGMLL